VITMRQNVVASLLVAGLLGCSDGSGPADVLPAELTGEWTAYPGCLYTCGFTFMPLANPADSLNVIATFGLTVNLSLQRNGRMEMIALGGGPVDPVSGRARVDGAMLILTDDEGAVDTADYVLDAGRLRLQFREIVSLNGQDARVRASFQRR
jgi:hypothetical protein